NVGCYYYTWDSKLGTSLSANACGRSAVQLEARKFDFTDLTRPHTWYPIARRKKRNVILHVGPTNSGKTYNALKRLESSSSGIYCGPLRLLAWEIAQRMNKAKVPCDLITGQEREEVDGAKHKAVTVEMADVTSEYSCAVVDEIQMLGCRTRGFSFTRALLGIAADELHLCGDAAAVPLIQEILKATEDNVKATMFNDENSDFDVLVASDAIGMGLNLNISRIIFSTLRKFDGVETRELTVSEIKQIAGRAGRYKSKFPVGEVTCQAAKDLPLLHSSLSSPSPILEQAGLFPNFDLLFLYSRLHTTSGLYQILEHFVENAKLSENYFIADCEQMMFAQSYSKTRIVRLKEIFTPGTLKVPKSHHALKELESIHKVLDLYVWLSFHLEDSFPDRELAASQKAICSMWVYMDLSFLAYMTFNM
ncbi:DExH-box ATP-dependent RNA helicase DExH16, mitochondrial, partial [Sesamum angolense]